MPEMIVGKVIKDNDRTLMYGNDPERDYHIIGARDLGVETGDVVLYEYAGYNFGWFVRVVGYVTYKDGGST